MNVDYDEFIIPKTHSTIPELLRHLESTVRDPAGSGKEYAGYTFMPTDFCDALAVDETLKRSIGRVTSSL